MNWFLQLITNPFLLTGLAAWFIAQVLKLIIHTIINKKLVMERLVGDGGMPSGHSATVTALATVSALKCGFGSFEFAVAMLLAIIVCHDAMGVRLETGKQARLLNEMTEIFEKLSGNDLPEVKLKEFVGHTPIQVFAGIAIGILMGFAMHFWILPLIPVIA